MKLSGWKQLEGFAFWHHQVLAQPYGRELWGLGRDGEARFMNQAPLYVLDGEPLDWYAEAVLRGKPRVDLSAQYRGDTFLQGNPLAGRPVEKEGDFFHYYISSLVQKNEKLPSLCSLYLEADIGEDTSKEVASFINLAGDMVPSLLPSLLTWRERGKETESILSWLQRMQEWCEPWHIGFMESREAHPLRLVLLLHHGLEDIPSILQESGGPTLSEDGWKLLQYVDRLSTFYYMLDVDVMANGSLGQTLGVEILPQEAIWPTTQQKLMEQAAYREFTSALQEAGLADERIQALPGAVFAKPNIDGTWIYSRISHFKLRWCDGLPLPAKVYVQTRCTEGKIQEEIESVGNSWGKIE